jgi:hypothetical protein
MISLSEVKRIKTKKQENTGLRITVSEWKSDTRFDKEMERLEKEQRKYAARRFYRNVS